MKIAIYNYFEILALVASVIYLPRLRLSVLKMFPIFLFLTVSVELGSKYIRSISPSFNANWVYNIFIAAQILFFLYLLNKESKHERTKKLTTVFIICFLLFHSINIVIGQGISAFNYHSYLLGSFFVIISSFLFLSELIDSPDEIRIVRVPMFWVSTASLVFFTGTFFYFLFFYFLVTKKMDIDGSLFRTILTILNILFYSLLILGFLCSRKEAKQS